MALYEDGKVKFTDEWINQFNDDALRAFLILKRYNLVDSKRSKYCTIEHLLYNNSIEELREDAFNFMLGFKKTTTKNYEENVVRTSIVLHLFDNVLESIRQKMVKENDW